MLLALVLYGLGIGVARTLMDVPEAVFSAERIRLMAGGLVLLAVVASVVTRARIVGRNSTDSLDDFWRGSLRKAIVLWSIAEFAGLTGLLMWFLSGDLFSYIILFGSGLGILFMTPPGRLEA